jgi:hypothetical protein
MTRSRVLPWVRSGQRAPTLPQLWAFVALAGIFTILGLTLVRPHDFWWHARVGQWIVENGRVPTADLFSFTQAGEPYAYALWWLMDVVLYLLLRTGDLPLVIFFHALVITAAYALLLRVCQRAAGGNLQWAALATLAAAAIGLDNWNVRPQNLSILLFALTLYLLERQEWRLQAGLPAGRKLWWLVPLFALWSNAHGAFVSGLMLLGTYVLAQLLAWLRHQRPFPVELSLVALASGAATLVNPLGLGMVNSALHIARHPVNRQLTVEWMPPAVRSLEGQIFFGFVAIFVTLLLVSGYRPRPHESVRLLLFGALALVARRNTLWFGFVAAPTMAAAIHHLAVDRGFFQGKRAGRPGLNLAIAALAGLLLFLSLPWFRLYLPLPEWRRTYMHRETPVQAVAFLSDLPGPHRVFHSEAYGSYMIWAAPQVPVFIDTRIELYPAEQWNDYLALLQARYNWEEILESYEVDTLVLDRVSLGALIGAATAAEDWQLIYEDEQAMIFARQGEP